MQDLGIDLRLAVNYLPACVCALQSLALSFALCALHTVRLLPAFVAVGLALVVDRSSRPCFLRVFDGNSVLFSIFLSHCVAAMQELGSSVFHLWPVLHSVFSVEWPLISVYFLVNPLVRRDHLRVCLCLACFRVSCCAFLYRPDSQELRLLRVGRDMAFAGLCLVWTYVVGIYRRRLTHQPTESATHFAVYFWPVLYAHVYSAAVYSCIALAVIVLQLRQPDSPQHHPAQSQQPACDAQQDSAIVVVQPPQDSAPALPDEDDELLLRQALSARSGGAY